MFADFEAKHKQSKTAKTTHKKRTYTSNQTTQQSETRMTASVLKTRSYNILNTTLVLWFEERACVEISRVFVVVVVVVLLSFCLLIGLFVVVVFVLLSP